MITVSTYVWDIRIPGVPNMHDADVLAVRRQFHQTLMRLLLAKRSAKLSLNEVRALFAGHSPSHGIRSHLLFWNCSWFPGSAGRIAMRARVRKQQTCVFPLRSVVGG